MPRAANSSSQRCWAGVGFSLRASPLRMTSLGRRTRIGSGLLRRVAWPRRGTTRSHGTARAAFMGAVVPGVPLPHAGQLAHDLAEQRRPRARPASRRARSVRGVPSGPLLAWPRSCRGEPRDILACPALPSPRWPHRARPRLRCLAAPRRADACALPGHAIPHLAWPMPQRPYLEHRQRLADGPQPGGDRERDRRQPIEVAALLGGLLQFADRALGRCELAVRFGKRRLEQVDPLHDERGPAGSSAARCRTYAGVDGSVASSETT